MNHNNKVVFVGGGTGGHLMPIIAIGRELKRQEKGIELYYIGPADKAVLSLLKKEKFIIHRIPGGKLRRYFSFQNISDILFKIPFGFLQSFFLLLLIRPRLIFSKGGTGSFVSCYAGRLLRIPIFVHESDIVPGLSNKKVSRFAKKIFVAFEKTEYFDPQNITVVGNPIRTEVLSGNTKTAKKALGLSSTRPVILFWGGSQGAEFINDFLISTVNDLLKKYEVIHVAGPKNFVNVTVQSKMIVEKRLQPYYHLYGSLNEEQTSSALAAADVIISRTGSASIFEIAAMGKPSILVPLPSAAGNHQSKNAEVYAKTGAAIVIEQGVLTPNFFIEEVRRLTLASQKKKMGAAALQFAKPDAAKIIAKEIIAFLKNDIQKEEK